MSREFHHGHDLGRHTLLWQSVAMLFDFVDEHSGWPLGQSTATGPCTVRRTYRVQTTVLRCDVCVACSTYMYSCERERTVLRSVHGVVLDFLDIAMVG